MELRNWTTTVGVLGLMLCFRGELPAEEPSEDLLAGHPRTKRRREWIFPCPNCSETRAVAGRWCRRCR